MKKKALRRKQPVKRHRLLGRWLWPAIGIGAVIVVLGLAALIARPSDTQASLTSEARPGDAHTYFSPTWHDCPPFVEEVLKPAVSGQNKIVVHDFRLPEDRQLLMGAVNEVGLPATFNSFMFTFVQREGTQLVLLGHPPQDLIEQALRVPGLPEKLVIDQEEMHEAPKTYDLWPFKGEVKRYAITTPLDEALREVGALRSEPAPVVTDTAPMDTPSSALLPTVLISGLADSINPCAFAVMAFFTALLFALRRTRQQILQMGAVYIVGMYITYFGLGLGLLRALSLLGQPHLVSQVGATLVITLGLIQIKDGLFPGPPIHLTVPESGWQLIQSWAKRTSLPAALVLGALVGLCTLPCSGGIYVAILGLLSSQASYAAGIGYLSLYNLMYIAPLAAILLVVSSRPMSLALAGWERGHAQRMHLFVGVIMVALGILILGWLA